MIRGIDTAATGMKTILELNDIVANNLANVNTPGFKQLMPSFRDVEEVEVDSVGTLSAGSILDTTRLDFSQGALKKTNSPLDVAINGDGFFAVKNSAGEEFYTRNGGFVVNEEGVLATRTGEIVLGEGGGEINIDVEGKSVNDILITNNGTIMLDNQEVDRLMLVNFEDLSGLKARGNSLFENIDENNRPVELESPSVAQGYIESSNANVVESLINSITGSRTYETLSKVIRDTDVTLRKAVTDVGRVI